MTTPRNTSQGLTRVREGAIVGGVAAGLARRMDISPSWVRLGFIIATFFGGLGAVLYLVGWATIPEEGDDKAIVEDFLADRRGRAGWLGLGLIVLAIALLLGATDLFSFELVFAAALFLAGYLLYRDRTAPPPPGGGRPGEDLTVASAAPSVVDSPPAGDLGGGATAAPPAAAWVSPVVDVEPEPIGDAVAVDSRVDDTVTLSPPPPPPPPPVRHEVTPPAPAPPRPRSYLGRLTMAALLITIGTMALLENMGVVELDLGDFFAAAMLVFGGGLLVGTFFGRARGLILAGLLLAPLLIAGTAIRIPVSGEWGSETVVPASATDIQPEYDHGVGQFILDLSGVDLTDDTSVAVDQGIGQMRVVVPDDVSLSIDGHAGAGAVIFFGDEDGGFDFDRSYDDVVEGRPTLSLDLEVGAGAIEITGPRAERPLAPTQPQEPLQPTVPTNPLEPSN